MHLNYHPDVLIQFRTLDEHAQNMSDNDASGFIFNSKAPYQSAQRKGQWIYSRYMNVSGEHELYANKTLELATTPGGAVTTGINGFLFFSYFKT